MVDRDVTCEWTKNAADHQAVAEGCYFDLAAAERVRDFARKFIRHSKGQWAGKPFELLKWQWEDVIGPLFGWKRADGTRRFRKGYIEIPKKNGKSALGSLLSLYMLVGDYEPGAEVYNAAADREQASIVFNESANMVEASPALLGKLTVVRSTKRITFAGTRSWYKALSADVPTKEGLNIHFLLFDELHAQKTREMWDTLNYGGAARRQPLFLSITTAGYDRDSICYEQHLLAERIISGEASDSAFFAYIRAAKPEDDWTSPQVWRDANPSIDITIPEVDFTEKCLEAQNSPAQENSFRRYRLNQWTEQDIRWLSMERWDRCNKAAIDESDGDLENFLLGRECYAGLDLAATTDIAALVLLFPIEKLWFAKPFFWVPENACKERERRNKTRLDKWINGGLIEACSEDTIDQDQIRTKIGELAEQYNIRQIAKDPWNSTQLGTQLMGDGFDVVDFRQGFASMSAPTKELEALVLSERVIHDGNEVLRWMVGNVMVEQDAAGNLKPSKKKSTEKIDGVVALIMALGVAMKGEGGEEKSYYDTHGLLST